MDFFANQENARKKTFYLVFYFLIAIILIILAIDAIVIGIIVYFNQNFYFLVDNGNLILNQPAIIRLIGLTSTIVIPLVTGIIVIGSIIKSHSLRNGGISVATMVNAKPISMDTTDISEQRFIHVVEEMSLASGVPIPKLYIMENETAINAFVAGIKPADTVMVVTKGALEQLNRDELQGVIGHEFSHIFNSDMQISLKLMGLLAGLLFIGQAGFFILRFIRIKGNRSNSKDGQIMMMILAMGLGLLIIGYIGLFFGRLIKAAVSRQRELLADSSSVAYTRNPSGLVGALKRIQLSEVGSNLNSKNAEDLSHMCFCPSIAILFKDLLATHPPLDQRIKILDPENQYSLSNAPKKKQETLDTKPQTPQTFNTLTTAALVYQSIGNPTENHVAQAKDILKEIPENLMLLARSPSTVDQVIYALITPQENPLPAAIQLPLLDIALPAFKENEAKKRQEILKKVENLLSQTNQGLFQFTLYALLSHAVPEHRSKTKIRYTEFTPVLTDISWLLSHIIQNGSKDAVKGSQLYDKVMNYFTTQKIPQSAEENFDATKLQLTLARLNQLSPQCKNILIKACLECIEHDNIISIPEAELVRAIAACLDCPIPPIVPQ